VLGVVGDSYERGTEFKGYLARVILRGGADQSSHKVTLSMRWRPKRCAKSSGQPLGLPRSRIRILTADLTRSHSHSEDPAPS
jgi:hypothetical protein